MGWHLNFNSTLKTGSRAANTAQQVSVTSAGETPGRVGIGKKIVKPFAYTCFALLLSAAIFVNGCTSPTDVDAQRTVRPVNERNDNTDQIVFDRNVLAFEHTLRHVRRRASITMRNTGTESVTIHKLDIDLEQFSVDKTTMPLLPFELYPIGHPASVESFDILFSPTEFGDYLGNLFLNNNDVAKVALNGISPEVSVEDLNFGAVNGLELRNAVIQNHSDKDVMILDAVVSFPLGIFLPSGFPEFPVILKAGESVGFLVTFEPQSQNLVKGLIEFKIDGADYVDNICELTGRGR